MWQVDAETRAMLDRMKAPKKIDASAAAEPPVERKGSAWNSGGTWEEENLSPLQLLERQHEARNVCSPAVW